MPSPTHLPRWFSERPWLAEFSPWITTLGQGERATRRFEGAYGLGNGQVFGIVGLGDPLNTLSGSTGPSYDAGENFFGDTRIGVEQAGRTLTARRQSAMRVAGTAINATSAELDEGLVLTTVDFVPPDRPALVRLVTLANTGTAPQGSLRLVVQTTYDREESFAVQGGLAVQHRGPRSAWMRGIPLEGGAVASFDQEALVFDVPALDPGEEALSGVLFVYTMGDDVTQAAQLSTAIESEGVLALLDLTQLHWQRWLEAAPRLLTPEPRLDDLVETTQIVIGVQTDRYGAVSPMSRYTKAWLRDTIGGVRFFSRLGRTQEARAMLDYLYKMHVALGGIRNSVTVGQDVSWVQDPSNPATFWEEAEFMPGREPVEAPSYLPLAYADLYRAGGLDTALLEARYDYLRTALTRQERSPEGLMRFSGDETFRYTLMWALGVYQDPSNLAWSANSNLLYLGALRSMAELARALGREGEATSWEEEYQALRAQTDGLYWQEGRFYTPVKYFDDGSTHPWPYEDVTTKALFFGAIDRDTEHARTLVSSLVEDLMRPDGTLLSPPGLLHMAPPGYTGMVPGLFLYNMAAVDHPELDLAIDGLGRTASPSGTWEELHWRDHTALAVLHAPSGRNAGEVAARYRPWEGGEDADALLYALTGLELHHPARTLRLRPHLPADWPRMAVEGLRAGPSGRWDMELERGADHQTLTVTSMLEDDFTLELTLSQTDISWEEVSVNGAPWTSWTSDTVYGEVARVHVREVPLRGGETLTLKATW